MCSSRASLAGCHSYDTSNLLTYWKLNPDYPHEYPIIHSLNHKYVLIFFMNKTFNNHNNNHNNNICRAPYMNLQEKKSINCQNNC